MGHYDCARQNQRARNERARRPLNRFLRLLGKIVLFPVWLIVEGISTLLKRWRDW